MFEGCKGVPAHAEAQFRVRRPETYRWQCRLPLPPAGWPLSPLEVLRGWQPGPCEMEASSLFPGVREKGYSWELFPKSGQEARAPGQAGIDSH